MTLGARGVVTGDKTLAAWLALLLFGIYMIGFDGTLHSSDGLSMFAVAENIIKHGRFDTHQLLSWGNVALGLDGRPYTVFPLGPSLLMLPFLALSLVLPRLGATQTTLVLMPLSGALTAIYIYLITRRLGYPQKVGILVTLLLGLATMIWPRTRDLVVDPLLLLSLTAAFYYALAFHQDQELRQAALMGLFLSLTVLLKVISVFFVPLFFWYMASSYDHSLSVKKTNWKAVGVAGIAWSSCLLIIGTYNTYRFGNPLETGYPQAFVTPAWIGVLGYFISPYKSIFLYVPLYILIPFTIRRAWRSHPRETVLILLLVLVSIVIHGSWFDWGGGRSWGPRFLVPMNGLLVLLLLPFIRQAMQRHQWQKRIVLLVFIVLSLLLQIIGISARDYVYLDASSYWRALPKFSYFGELTWDNPSQWPIWGHMLRFDLNDIPVIWRWQWEGQAHFDFISLLAAVFIAVVGLLGVLIFVRRERSALWPSLFWSIAMGCVLLILFRSYDDPRSIKRAHEGARLYPAYSALLSQLPEIVEPDDAVIFTDRRFEFYLLDMDKAFASRYVVAKENQPIILETVPKLLQEVPEDGKIWLVADDLDNQPLAYSVELWLKERAHISERYLFGQSVRLVAFSPILKSPWEPISAEPELDRVVEPKEHTYKGIAAFLGWDWPEIEATESPVLEAGKSYNFSLFWIYGGMSMDDTLYVRLLNEKDRVAVEALSSDQHDSPLIPGQLLKDSITVSLPHSLPRGSYHLQIGFFTRAVEAGELNFSLPGEMTEVQVR